MSFCALLNDILNNNIIWILQQTFSQWYCHQVGFSRKPNMNHQNPKRSEIERRKTTILNTV